MKEVFSNIFFCHKFFKSHDLLQRRQKATICGKSIRRSRLVFLEEYHCFGLTLPYVTGTQNNCLREMIIFFPSNHNIMFEGRKRRLESEIHCTSLIKSFDRMDYTCSQVYPSLSCSATSRSAAIISSSVEQFTLIHIQQICSRRLWKYLGKHTEKLYKCRHNYWKELKTLWQKEKLLVLINFSFRRNVFKSCLLQRRQKAYIWENLFWTPHSPYSNQKQTGYINKSQVIFLFGRYGV